MCLPKKCRDAVLGDPHFRETAKKEGENTNDKQCKRWDCTHTHTRQFNKQ